MSDAVIRTVGLGKRYYTSRRREPYRTLRDVFANTLASPLKRVRRAVLRQPSEAADLSEPFWALKDVSFEIRDGEVVGVIGRNGAGKSTLLKVFSRITEPTAGYATVRGRVGSLLEVGTGFHPELTGRENIYLNGAILGMKRTHISRRFDEIVEFAEIGKFLDTPVKHYSSGMYMRLAFAVAAHLEPDILVVDEVLAVGDAAFQKKCLNKMQTVGRDGRTVLFVSHNMSAVTRLCQRAILLEAGHVKEDGPAPRVVSNYLKSESGTAAVREWLDPRTAPSGDAARLRTVRVRGEGGLASDLINVATPIAVEIEYEVLQSGFLLMPSIHLFSEDGIHAFSAVDVDPAWRDRRRPAGTYISAAWIPPHLLNEGTYAVSVGLTTLEPRVLQFYERDIVTFHVVDAEDRDSARGDWPGRFGGVVRPMLKWDTQFTPVEVLV